MRSSIQWKTAALYIVIIVAVLAVLNTYPILVTENLVFRSKQTSLGQQAAVMAASLSGAESLTPAGVGRVMDLLDDGSLDRVLVTDETGKILHDTTESGDTTGKYALFGEIASALSGNDYFFSEFRDGAFRSRAACPIVFRGVSRGAVYVYEYDTAQAALLKGIQSNLRNISIVVSLLVVLISLLFSRSLARRIGALLHAIRDVREGDYDRRAEIRGRDEIAQLADEFNDLTKRLRDTEEVRRRFVADASHELKTPLASIRLLTDSILQNENMDAKTARDFVADIGAEADRLTRISQELLQLARLDGSADAAAPAAPVAAAQAAARAVHMLRPLAAESGVTLLCDFEEGCTVLAREDEVYQIVFNLAENAVKYNLPGGRVHIGLRRGDDAVRITVENTGVGIPEEDMPRIFERFYRVDKARSREAGGTGLGLSIVQEAVRRRGGDVGVSPREGGGARFVVTLPLWREGAP
jgi:signal transduction histidine kinase